MNASTTIIGGPRPGAPVRVLYKGAWVLHMLRQVRTKAEPQVRRVELGPGGGSGTGHPHQRGPGNPRRDREGEEGPSAVAVDPTFFLKSRDPLLDVDEELLVLVLAAYGDANAVRQLAVEVA